MKERELIEKVFRQAFALGACDKFRGNESLEEMAELIKSPQGTEFCIENKFPNIKTFVEFKNLGISRYGVYINMGDINIENEKSIVVVGRTTALITCAGNEHHRIVLLNGACAVVTAKDWAVVTIVSDKYSHVIKKQLDNSIIL